MKQSFFLLISCLFISFQINAQEVINAITETGDEVILYPNKTWAYLEKDRTIEYDIPVNNTETFTKSKDAKFLLKSKITDIGIYLNSKKWAFERNDPKESDSEYSFVFRSEEEEIYALLISEKLIFPLENLANIAYTNASLMDPNVVVNEIEYRTVNGLEVIMMYMSAHSQGIDIAYLGYYFTNEAGSNQLVTYCTQQDFPSTKKYMLELLNGMVTQ